MEKIKSNLATSFIAIIFIVYFLSFFIPLFKEIVESYLMYMITAVCLFANILYLRNINVKSLFAILPFLICFGISLAMSISGFGSYLNVINVVLIVLTAKRIILSPANYKILLCLSYVLLIILWVKSMTVWNNYVLNIADDNPNTIAQGLVLIYGVICAGINNMTLNKTKYFFFIAISLITLLSIIRCNCRTALIVYLALIICVFFKNIKGIIEKNYKIILSLIILLGMAFPFIYVSMYKNASSIELPFMSGKDAFTGREIIWDAAIDELSNYENKGLLFGLGSHHETKIGVISNFHNWYLGMVYYFGIPLTILYFVYLVYELSKINNVLLKISMLSVFLIGFSETSALWPKSQFIIFILLVFNNFHLSFQDNSNKMIASEVNDEK